MKKAIVLGSLLFSVCCFAQTEVTAYGVGKGQEYGVTYALPKSVIDIEVEAIKIKYTPGEFSKYADRYLRMANISDAPQEYWELGKVKVISKGIPDPENTYFVKLKDKTLAPMIELTEDGLIVAINTAISKKTIPATLLTPAMKKPCVSAREFMTEEILMASSSAKMAELVAKEIYNIRESKNAMVRGQADNMPKDGESLKLMLANLEEQEQALMELFSGVTEKETKTFTVRIVPTGDVEKEIAFRFSTKLGIVGNGDLAGSPVYISIHDMNTLPASDPKLKKEKKKIEGIVYNVPGKARVSVFNNKKTFFEGELPITQFGNTESLAANLFEKKSTIQVLFYPETGGIEKVIRAGE